MTILRQPIFYKSNPMKDTPPIIDICGKRYQVEINEGKVYFDGVESGKFYDSILTKGQKNELDRVGFSINRLRYKVYNPMIKRICFQCGEVFGYKEAKGNTEFLESHGLCDVCKEK